MSADLRVIVVYLSEWMDNHRPHQSAYWSMMARRFISIDKHPGVKTFKVGETWIQIMEKCVLVVAVT